METTCKQGKLIISENSVQIQTLLGRVLWSIQRTAVLGVSAPRQGLGYTVIFQTAAGPFKAEIITKAKSQEIIALFN